MRDKMIKLRKELAKEQEELTPEVTPEVDENSETSVEDTLDEKVITDDLIEADEKHDEFVEADNAAEAINREVDESQEEAEALAADMESVENPTEEDLIRATERLEMFKYFKGLKDFTVASESMSFKYGKNNKDAMKEIATELRKQASYLDLARENGVGEKLADWLYTIFTFGHKRFSQIRRELTGSIYKNYDNLDEANKITVTKCLYRTVTEIVYLFKYFSATSVNKLTVDIEGMLKYVRKDAKDMADRMRYLFEVLDEIYKTLAKEHPIAVSNSATTNTADKQTERAEAEAEMERARRKAAEAALKALAKETLKKELETRDFGSIVKKTFSEDFTRYSINEYLANRRGEIETFMNSISLEAANKITSDRFKLIVDDIFDIYDYVGDYVFRECSYDAQEIIIMLDNFDIELSRYIQKFYNLSGLIKEDIHREIYDAFTILRKYK